MTAGALDSVLDIGVLVLQIVGATSLLGVFAFLTAWYALPPNLSIEEVKKKGRFNFESRLSIRNIGRLPAFNVIVDVEKMNLVMGGINMQDMTAIDCGVPTQCLAAGETMELPACPHVGVPPGTNLASCDYELILKYEQRMLFFKRHLKKRYHVELRNSGDEFTWQFTLR